MVLTVLPVAQSSLVGAFVHGMLWALGWHAGSLLARLLGPLILVLAVVAVVAYFRRRRHSRRF